MPTITVTDATLEGTFTGTITYADTPPIDPPPEETNSVSLFTTQTPVLLDASDGASVTYELGTKFKSTTGGNITALRFWKGDKETSGHTGHVWSASGSKLATVTFSNETASGWQQQALGTPLHIDAQSTYTASVGTSNSYFATTENGLKTSVSNGPLSTVVGNNGCFGPRGACPTQSHRDGNYFRDVVFVADTGSTAPPPSGDLTFPDASNSGVPAGTTLTDYTGPMTITTPGTVIDGKIIQGTLTVAADNVTIKNCLVEKFGWWGILCLYSDNRYVPNTRVEHCTIDGTGSTKTSGMLIGTGDKAAVIGCNITGMVIAINMSGAAEIRDNYIHDLNEISDNPDDRHFDGIRAMVSGAMITHNTIILPDGSGGTAAVFIKTESSAPISNLRVRDNLMKGDPSATIYVEYSQAPITDVIIENNYLERGVYGYFHVVNSQPIIRGNFNWNNGSPIPLTASEQAY